MRLLTIATALRNGGLVVVEYPGWKERGGIDFDPVGVMAHHTAGSATGDAPSLKVCVEGRSDLPGPLCHVVLARSGICHVIASGRANHAGAGSWKGVSGNKRFLGIEAENTGRGEPWPPNQVDAYVRATAALLRLIGADSGWAVGHKEYTPRKIDPAGIDMDDFRRRVDALLDNAPHSEDFIAMAALDRLDAQKGVVRQLFRTFLLRNPDDQAELDYHVLALARDGYEARVRAFVESAEGAAVLAKERKAVGL